MHNGIDENMPVITKRIGEVTKDLNHRFIKELKGEFSVSLGFSVYPSDAENLEDIIRNSDSAMYEAKTYNGTKLVSFCDLE